MLCLYRKHNHNIIKLLTAAQKKGNNYDKQIFRRAYKPKLIPKSNKEL